MKKSIINSLFAIIIVAAVSFKASSQDLAISGNKQTTNNIYTSVDEVSPTISVNEIDKRVLKAFKKSYGQVAETKWFKVDKGYGVSFNSKGMKTIIFYAGNGVFDSRINYYGEDKLPSHVYSLVKSNFAGFNISTVAEVNKNEVVAYLVKIQDKYTVKTIKVIGEDWELVETLVKN